MPKAIRHNLRLNKIAVLDFYSPLILSLHKIGCISAKQLKQAWLFCSRFALSLQMNFAKECLKTYDALIHYIGKNRNFVIQAINSENDQKIGRKYNGNIAGDF